MEIVTSSSRAMLIGSHLGFKRDVIIKVGADWIKLQSNNELIGRLQGLGYTWQYVIGYRCSTASQIQRIHKRDIVD